MARTLNLFNRQKNPYVKADGVNHEGFPTFKRSDEEAYLQVLLTNTLSGTFYANTHDLLKDSLALHEKMAAEQPEFMARAIVYARNEGFMRLQPIVGLAYLAKARRDLFRQIFHRVIRTPGDLTDFVEIVRGDVVPGGMGRAIKTAVNNWLNEMSEYHVIKYGTGGQGYSLRDVLRISHPKPPNKRQDALYIWLTDREKWLADAELRGLTPQIEAFEQIKRLDLSAEGAFEQARTLIKLGRLPYEVVTGVIKPDLDTWREMMRQMPYMALLRHLNTLQRAGVLNDALDAQEVADKLRNREVLKQVKILPFRLHTAYLMFKPQNVPEQKIADALIDALEITFENLPELGQVVCIAPDVSSSMAGRVSKDSMVMFADVASIFVGALIKKSAGAIVMPFDTQVVTKEKFSGRDSIMTNAQKIKNLVGGGTAISAPISELLRQRQKVDTFIGITDNEEWARDHTGAHGFLPQWNEYKQKVAPDAKAFLVTISPYRVAVAPQDTPDVHYIYGWNDNVLTYISMMLGGLKDQVTQVREMEV